MIDNDVKLTELSARLRAAPWVALDTEADSLHAYPEKICLIQVTTLDGDELIDPLSGIGLAPFLEELRTHRLIMHGSDYDLRLFRKHHEFVPTSIFDTMLAARLLGITQFGLTHLVAQYLGVTLDKGSQKADWAQRPLTERMEAYARNDTHYLKPLSDRLKAELEAKGRLSWQEESCARLIADCAELHPPDPDQVWRLKGSSNLSPASLAVLRELWRWRETEATAANRPPYFILRHESLIQLAIAAVAGQPLEPLLPQKFSDRRRHSALAAIRHGLAVPRNELPQPIRHTFRRVSDAHKRRAADLQQRRDTRAQELGIDPTLIASRATLLDLAEDWDKHQATLMFWQRELLK
ncbi:MAG TPA: HRDC domain-containing protein [Verrucomicrobiae bacterium]|nr:HRDC domain-containing protein [Verrucomicrobiae bacterium]